MLAAAQADYPDELALVEDLLPETVAAQAVLHTMQKYMVVVVVAQAATMVMAVMGEQEEMFFHN
jgi:hypothetical protein